MAALAVVAMVSAAGAAEDDEASAAMPVISDIMPCDRLAYSILVTVKNVKSAKGTVTVDLHGDDPDKWLAKGAKLARIREPAVTGETKVCIPVDRPGVYALALYHDKDANKKLNKTWIGLPSEPFGVSNDAAIRLGPPKHADAAFEVKGPATPVTVNLRGD
ncbi:MAG: DUF2141 domain-containing protein [Rhodospirillaceae bacterium]|nr:DUF2141 domain-containing protein [Rhodospirillaceae bacterium]